MKENCNIIDDLLPLYLENCCSQDSAELVENHLKRCPACRQKYTVLKAGSLSNQTGPPDSFLEITLCAKKVRRHRRRVGFLTALTAFLCACVLFISCLAIADMDRLANPIIHTVEDGVYNLTASDLETTAEQVGNYVLYTNYTQIQVSVSEETAFHGEVLLWDVGSLSSPTVIQYGQIDPDHHSCTFSGLTSARRYMVTCDADAQMPLTVSEGRTVNFFYSFGRVLGELFDYAVYLLF